MFKSVVLLLTVMPEQRALFNQLEKRDLVVILGPARLQPTSSKEVDGLIMTGRSFSVLCFIMTNIECRNAVP